MFLHISTPPRQNSEWLRDTTEWKVCRINEPGVTLSQAYKNIKMQNRCPNQEIRPMNLSAYIHSYSITQLFVTSGQLAWNSGHPPAGAHCQVRSYLLILLPCLSCSRRSGTFRAQGPWWTCRLCASRFHNVHKQFSTPNYWQSHWAIPNTHAAFVQ